jgi:hypothetical protein
VDVVEAHTPATAMLFPLFSALAGTENHYFVNQKGSTVLLSGRAIAVFFTGSGNLNLLTAGELTIYVRRLTPPA